MSCYPHHYDTSIFPPGPSVELARSLLSKQTDASSFVWLITNQQWHIFGWKAGRILQRQMWERTEPWAVFNLFSGVRLPLLMNRWTVKDTVKEEMNWMMHLLTGAGKHTFCLINKECYSDHTAALHWGASEQDSPHPGKGFKCMLSAKRYRDKYLISFNID